MSFNSALIYPANQFPNYTKKKLLIKNPSKIINLILNKSHTGSSSFQNNNKVVSKIFSSKKEHSLKGINLKYKIPLSKDNTTKFLTKEKILLKSNSENKKVLENYITKIYEHKRTKNNSFCVMNYNSKLNHESLNEQKNETFTKLRIGKKNHSSRNISRKNSIGSLNKMSKLEKKNNIGRNIIRQNKKMKLNQSYVIKNKTTFIPKFKNKINLSFYESQQKRQKNINHKYHMVDNKANENTCIYSIKHATEADKENINLNSNINKTDINDVSENLSLNKFKNNKNLKKKIKLPFSPNSNKKEIFKQIKSKKCFIRNNKNEINIPYNKKNKLTRQNSYYNFNSNNSNSIKNRRMINNTTREDASSLYDIDMSKKNNSIYYFDSATRTNANNNSFSNSNVNPELNIVKENNLNYIHSNESNIGVEMNHFKIVALIQENKNLLEKFEKKI
mgnify:CR=1 FL=1